MKPFIFFVTFMAVVVGYMVFIAIEDPISNFSKVPATVEVFIPSRDVRQKMGTFTVSNSVPEEMNVRLEDMSVWKADLSTISPDSCTQGGPATATVRIGQITHKVLKVVFVVCESREASR